MGGQFAPTEPKALGSFCYDSVILNPEKIAPSPAVQTFIPIEEPSVSGFLVLVRNATVFGRELTVGLENGYDTLFIMRIAAACYLLLVFSSCSSVLIGHVNPVDQKSRTYGVADLSKDPDWIKLDPKSLGNAPTNQDSGTTSTEVADVAYQSKSTASIISLDSACRPGDGYSDQTLRTLTNTLLLGTSNVTLRDEQPLRVENTPALQTTIQGLIGGEQVKLRAVVLKRQRCVYDLVYVARPDRFATHEQDFSHFVASLRLK